MLRPDPPGRRTPRALARRHRGATGQSDQTTSRCRITLMIAISSSCQTKVASTTLPKLARAVRAVPTTLPINMWSHILLEYIATYPCFARYMRTHPEAPLLQDHLSTLLGLALPASVEELVKVSSLARLARSCRSRSPDVAYLPVRAPSGRRLLGFPTRRGPLQAGSSPCPSRSPNSPVIARLPPLHPQPRSSPLHRTPRISPAGCSSCPRTRTRSSTATETPAQRTTSSGPSRTGSSSPDS